MKNRDKEIKALRKKNNTLQVIALKYGISDERVRQILNHGSIPSSRVRELQRQKEYLDKIEILMKKNIMSEIIRLSKQDRTKDIALERAILIKLLRNEYEFSFNQIGFLLNRDHTTVIHNYHKKI